jgi:hypothetical protein
VQGTLTVSSEGTVELAVDGNTQSPAVEWARHHLTSVIRQRMPFEADLAGAEYSDQYTPNPFSRKIEVKKDGILTSYRVGPGGYLREISRTMGDTRCTTTVLTYKTNCDEKVLPSTQVVSYWDTKSGDLKKTETYASEWVRTSAFDLPKRVLVVVSAANGLHDTREIRLSDHELNK